MKTITKHYIDEEFVESHGLEVMDMINPTIGKVIAHVTWRTRRMRSESPTIRSTASTPT